MELAIGLQVLRRKAQPVNKGGRRRQLLKTFIEAVVIVKKLAAGLPGNFLQRAGMPHRIVPVIVVQ